MGKKSGRWLFWLIIVISLILSACTTGTSAPIQQELCPTPTPISADIPPPPIPTPKIFDPKQSLVNRVILRELRNGELDKLSTDNLSLAVLITEVKKWSFSKEIKTADDLRMTIIFIHPELMRAVLWNDLVHHKAPDKELHMYRGLVDGVIERWSKTEEFLFLIIMTTNNSGKKDSLGNSLFVDIKKISLSSTLEQDIYPVQYDKSLNLNTQTENGKKAGFVMFPTRVPYKSGCVDVLDIGRDTSLTLHIPSIKINDNEISNLAWTWEFPFIIHEDFIPESFETSTVLDQIKPSYVITSTDTSKNSPLDEIPRTDAEDFDLSLARYVWYKLIEMARYP